MKTDRENVHISLCMIVKNEEKYLGKCLSCATKFVDEIILVDTGSTDGSKEIARMFGARIFDFGWNEDFAAARNFSLQQATGKWILVLDADEYLNDDSADKISDLTKLSDAPDIYLLPIRNVMDAELGEYQTSLVLRLFKNSPDLLFSGKIHEQVLVPADKKVEVVETGVYIIHLGYLDNRRTQKNIRNMRMLKRALEEDQVNPYHHFYISTEYILREDYQTALVHIRKALRGIPPEVLLFRTVCIRNAVLCLSKIGQFDEAESILLSEIAIYPGFPDYYYYLGNVYREKGCFGKAVQQYNRALAIKEPSLAGCSMSGSNGYKSLYYRGLCQQEMCRYFEAVDSFKSALDNSPSFTVPLADLVRCLLRVRRPQECLEYLEKNFDIINPDLQLILAQVLLAEGFPEIAGKYISSNGNPALSPKVVFFLGETALANNKPAVADNYFKKVPETDPLYVSSLVFRCICSWKRNKPASKKIISALTKTGTGKNVSGLIHYLDSTIFGNMTKVDQNRHCDDKQASLKFGQVLICKLLELNMHRQAQFLYNWLIVIDSGIRLELMYQFKKTGNFPLPGNIEEQNHEPSFYAEMVTIYAMISSDFLKKVPILPERPLL